MDTDRLKELLEVKVPVAAIARQYGLSRSQIYRQIHRENIVYARHSDISEEVMVTGHLRQRGIFVQRDRIRSVIREVDPEGVESRQTHSVHRRVYQVPCPHYVWHLDGNH